jgi:hypothetical protein
LAASLLIRYVSISFLETTVLKLGCIVCSIFQRSASLSRDQACSVSCLVLTVDCRLSEFPHFCYFQCRLVTAKEVETVFLFLRSKTLYSLYVLERLWAQKLFPLPVLALVTGDFLSNIWLLVLLWCLMSLSSFPLVDIDMRN